MNRKAPIKSINVIVIGDVDKLETLLLPKKVIKN